MTNGPTEHSHPVVVVDAGTSAMEQLLLLSDEVLAQRRYLTAPSVSGSTSTILGVFAADQCLGFLRLIVQAVGADMSRPPIQHRGRALTEGFVEAFGVRPEHRRSGIGTALQRRAAELARSAGCHQMRSRSPITSHENWAMKIDSGYTIQPSEENDSCYFLLAL